jgi:prenyl protein peptidase
MLRLGLTMHPTRLHLSPHLITPLLFAGPLYAMYLSKELPFMSDWSYDIDVRCKFFTWQGVRNYIMASRLFPSW